jgi:hypothetical protein
MITAVIVGGLFAASLLALVTGLPRQFSTARSYERIAWLPLGALLTAGILWKPVLVKLSYFAAVVPLLACMASVFLAAVGVTLLWSARTRDDDFAVLLRATFIAAIPGMLLFGFIVYGAARAVA